VFPVNYAWKAKIGLIYMAAGEIMEPEFYAMAPEGVVTLTTRIHFAAMTAQVIREMLSSDELEHCTQLLALAQCDVILFGGTSCSFLGGPKWEEGLLRRMKEMSGGITVTNTAQASVQALRAVNAKKIVFAAPYTADINKAGVGYFTKQGFEVLQDKGLGMTVEHEIATMPLGDVYRLARDADVPEADAVFISCTGMPTIPIIEALEADLKKPVVSAIQASMWYALKLVGIHDFVPGTGSLFEA
jgi:maleate isomerase